MVNTLTLDTPETGNVGDEFSFRATPNSWLGTQYHLAVTGVPVAGLIIGIWGPDNPTLGKARNKPGQAFVDRTLPAGTYRITVTGAAAAYEISIATNSWWKKIFGSEHPA